jgi:hypothetical protein
MSDEIEREAQLSRYRVLAGPASFAPGFADRVMRRVARAPSLAESMQLVFRRMAPLATAAVVLIAAINVFSTRASNQSLAERVLGLPAVVTVASAYSLESDLLSWGGTP